MSSGTSEAEGTAPGSLESSKQPNRVVEGYRRKARLYTYVALILSPAGGILFALGLTTRSYAVFIMGLILFVVGGCFVHWRREARVAYRAAVEADQEVRAS